MSEGQQDFNEQELDAPQALVEALGRLDSQTVLMTPQADEAVLDRPRLHLARIRELRGYSGEGTSEREADLALAAHAEETRRARPNDFGPVLPADSGRAPRPRWWRPILLGAAAALAAAAVASLFLPPGVQSGFPHGSRSVSSPGGMPLAIPLFVGSLALFAAWLTTRSK